MEQKNKTDIEYLSKLARMELNADEKAVLEKDIDSIIGYMDMLSKINTDGVEPMEHVLGLSNVMRDDVPAPSYDRDAILDCAPHADDGFYDVPLAVEQ